MRKTIECTIATVGMVTMILFVPTLLYAIWALNWFAVKVFLTDLVLLIASIVGANIYKWSNEYDEKMYHKKQEKASKYSDRLKEAMTHKNNQAS